ncbi:MAG: hypothetical protein Q4C86_11130 [bacterium]|nr:hypothetical protein [bacterium]
MNKNSFEKISLAKGEVNLYDFGGVKLHAYRTNDFLADEVFVVEKGGQAVVIESPCFFDNEGELEEYIAGTGLAVAGLLLAYHMGGGGFLSGAKRYATKRACEYGHRGGGRALIDSFAETFGAAFDNAVHQVTDYIEPGEVTIGGIRFNIIPTHEAFDIEIPEIDAVYTHMLGHDCHSIVAGAAHAEAMIGQLKGFLAKGYRLVLTSHYTPEDLKDVETKIAYLEALTEIAAGCADAEGFKAAVKRRYGNYGGENYLEMTARFFFN